MPAPSIPSSLLTGLLGSGRAAALLAAGNLPLDTAEIDHLTFWRLLRDNIVRTGDEHHALGANVVPEGSFELLLAAMRLGTNLADGLERLAGAARILRPDLGIVVSRKRHLVLQFAPGAVRSVQQALYVELIVVVIHAAICWMTGSVFRPRAIMAAPCAEAGSGAVYALLGTPIQRRGNGVAVHYAAADGGRALSAEAFDLWPTLVFEAYRQLANSATDASAATADQVRARLLMGRVDQTTVAREMAISVASLRRRLADEGHRFRDLDREVRQSLARDGIVAGRKTEDIASDLGYSEARSLRRAANRWFGKPPTGLRQLPID